MDSQVCQEDNNNSTTSTPFPFHFHHRCERDTNTLSEEQSERIELFSHDVNLQANPADLKKKKKKVFKIVIFDL